MKQICTFHRRGLQILSKSFIAISLFLLLVSCRTSPAPDLVGTWMSKQTDVTFEFFQDGTYCIIDPNSPFATKLTGRYYPRGGGRVRDLSGVQFVLVNGYDIQFTPDGTAFFINIDGAASGILYHKVRNE
jgi:hypothetical protein